MTLVMLCAIPLLTGAYRLQGMVADGTGKKEDETLRMSQQVIVDAVQNARTVHACGNEADLVALYDGMVSGSLQGLVRRALGGGIFLARP